MKLRTIFVVMALLAFTCAATGGYLYYSSIKSSALKEAENNIALIADSIKSHLSSHFQDNMKSVKLIAGLDTISDLLLTGTGSLHHPSEKLLVDAANALSVEVVYVMNHDGMTIETSNRYAADSFLGNNYGFRPYFINAMNGEAQIYMALGITSNKRGIYYSHPVYLKNGKEPAGVTVIKASAEKMEEKLINNFITENISFVIADSEGMVFLSNCDDMLLKHFWLIDATEKKSSYNLIQYGEKQFRCLGFTKNQNNILTSGNGVQYLMNIVDIDEMPKCQIIVFKEYSKVIAEVKKPVVITQMITILFLSLVGFSVFLLYKQASSEINKRKKAENDLKNSYMILDGILKASPIGIGLAHNREIKWGNEAFRNIFKYKDEDDYKGKITRILYVSDEEYERVGNVVYSTIELGKTTAEADVKFIRKDGSIFDGHIKISSPDPLHPMENTVFAISDESFRRKIEEERLNTQKLEGVIETAGAVSHELSQPMMAILGYIEIAMMNMSPINPLHDKLSKISNQIRRMSRITKKLMHITRYEVLEYGKGLKIINIDKSTDSLLNDENHNDEDL